jgi:hypothetical protein
MEQRPNGRSGQSVENAQMADMTRKFRSFTAPRALRAVTLFIKSAGEPFNQAVTMLLVFAQMSRNKVLNQLVGTTPDQVG